MTRRFSSSASSALCCAPNTATKCVPARARKQPLLHGGEAVCVSTCQALQDSCAFWQMYLTGKYSTGK